MRPSAADMTPNQVLPFQAAVARFGSHDHASGWNYERTVREWDSLKSAPRHASFRCGGGRTRPQRDGR